MGADEVCRNLGELGLTLIVGNIDDEAVRARVLEAGVPLGQGGLFGSPVAAPGGDFAAADHAAA
jgi:EAL domain-containing protein (putative c-di-GMP-specific phosphodiesterase class I)